MILKHLIIIQGSKKDCLVVTNQQGDRFAPGAADLLSLEGKLPALTKPLLRSDVSRDLFPNYLLLRTLPVGSRRVSLDEILRSKKNHDMVPKLEYHSTHNLNV